MLWLHGYKVTKKIWVGEKNIRVQFFPFPSVVRVAAKKLNLPFIGVEINEKYCEIINERLN